MSNMPHFIIGGERRSGSTTLYKIMLQHPEINMYPQSDMDYFIRDELFGREWMVEKDDDARWYANHTPEAYAAKFDGLFQTDKIVGQKDADLLFWKPAHARLKSFVPNAKFIFVLRDPVKRADSQYWNEVAKGRETLGFEEALAAESGRALESDYGLLHLNYKERGKYIDSINHFRSFFPDEQILIVILEKLKNEPAAELEKIAAFLGVSRDGFRQAGGTHSNHQDVLQIKARYKGTWVEKLIAMTDRIAEALIVRLSKDKDVRDAWRGRLKSFCKESVRTSSKPDEALVKAMRNYYTDSIAELETYLGYEIGEWK